MNLKSSFAAAAIVAVSSALAAGTVNADPAPPTNKNPARRVATPRATTPKPKRVIAKRSGFAITTKPAA